MRCGIIWHCCAANGRRRRRRRPSCSMRCSLVANTRPVMSLQPSHNDTQLQSRPNVQHTSHPGTSTHSSESGRPTPTMPHKAARISASQRMRRVTLLSCLYTRALVIRCVPAQDEYIRSTCIAGAVRRNDNASFLVKFIGYSNDSRPRQQRSARNQHLLGFGRFPAATTDDDLNSCS